MIKLLALLGVILYLCVVCVACVVSLCKLVARGVIKCVRFVLNILGG
jgi:hypothetical protein